MLLGSRDLSLSQYYMFIPPVLRRFAVISVFIFYFGRVLLSLQQVCHGLGERGVIDLPNGFVIG